MVDQEYELVVDSLNKILLNNPQRYLPTQKQVSLPIVVRIAKKIQHGLFASSITVKDNIICGGHHRYLATLLVDKRPEIIPGELASDQLVFKWADVLLSPVDFDSEEDREHYLLETAQLNRREAVDIRNILNKFLNLYDVSFP